MTKVRDLRVNGENEKDLAVLGRVVWEHVRWWGRGAVPDNFTEVYPKNRTKS